MKRRITTFKLFSLTVVLLFLFVLNTKFSLMRISSGSMEPSFSVNSFVLIEKSDFTSLQVGDVIVYSSSALDGELVFHRIIKISQDGITCKGDNNKHQDGELIKEEKYIGKCIFYFPYLSGYLNQLNSFKNVIIYFFTPLFLLIIIVKTGKYLLVKRCC